MIYSYPNNGDENQRLIGYGTTGNLQAGLTSGDFRQPATQYAAGRRVFAHDASGYPGYLLVCQTAGTSGTASISFSAGTACQDGTVVWMPYDMKSYASVSGHVLKL